MGWAFSATGAMEGMWMNSHSTLYSLSNRKMVDCGQGSCNGGYMDSAWQTVRNGANTEADYPYEARDGQCRAKSNSFVATNSGSQRVSHSESSLESAMAQVGYSISVAIHVGSSFQHYSGGTFSDPQCQYGQLNHGVLAVGYDHGSNWIVKNSWGGLGRGWLHQDEAGRELLWHHQGPHVPHCLNLYSIYVYIYVLIINFMSP